MSRDSKSLARRANASSVRAHCQPTYTAVRDAIVAAAALNSFARPLVVVSNARKAWALPLHPLGTKQTFGRDLWGSAIATKLTYIGSRPRLGGVRRQRGVRSGVCRNAHFN